MAALEESLGRALKAKGVELREQRLRGEWTLAAAASYVLDAAFLGAFAALGTLSAAVPVAYAAGGLALSALFYLVERRGWNLKLRDPSMVAEQCVAGLAMQLAVVWAAPQVFFPYVANLFTVFAFAMVWLPVRASIAVWLLGCAGTGAVLAAVSGRIGVPHATAAETFLVWLFFSAVLGRCVFLSVQSSAIRVRLAESREKLARSLEQIQDLVSHDELTKALNRRTLMARLDEERRRTERTGEGFCVALFDLDHFKRVNDAHGHAAGDEVLRRFTAIVHATIRDTDIFGRYGGEEFMLLLPATAPQAALGALDRVHESLRRADQALYRAKNEGRDCTRLA